MPTRSCRPTSSGSGASRCGSTTWSPLTDDSTRPYWEAARDERLVMQRCDACGSMQYPPDLVCNNCQSAGRHFEEVSGRGTVYSHAVYTRSFSAGFEAPYVLALVDLEDHP